MAVPRQADLRLPPDLHDKFDHQRSERVGDRWNTYWTCRQCSSEKLSRSTGVLCCQGNAKKYLRDHLHRHQPRHGVLPSSSGSPAGVDSGANPTKITFLLVLMLIKCGLPFNVVENPSFKEFVHALNPSYRVPSRTTLTRRVLAKLYGALQDTVRGALALPGSGCYMSLDTWTSRSTQNYLGIMLNFADELFRPVSLVLGLTPLLGPATGANLRAASERAAVMWRLPFSRVAAIVTDGAKNMASASAGVVHFTCVVHKVQTIIRHALSNFPSLESFYGNIQKIMAAIKASSAASRKFKDEQRATRKLRPVLRNMTRWNSTLAMLRRVEETFYAVVAVNNDLANTASDDRRRQRARGGPVDPDWPTLGVSDIPMLHWSIEFMTPLEYLTKQLESSVVETPFQLGAAASELFLAITTIFKIRGRWEAEGSGVPADLAGVVRFIEDSLVAMIRDLMSDDLVCAAMCLNPEIGLPERRDAYGIGTQATFLTAIRRVLIKAQQVQTDGTAEEARRRLVVDEEAEDGVRASSSSPSSSSSSSETVPNSQPEEVEAAVGFIRDDGDEEVESSDDEGGDFEVTTAFSLPPPRVGAPRRLGSASAAGVEGSGAEAEEGRRVRQRRASYQCVRPSPEHEVAGSGKAIKQEFAEYLRFVADPNVIREPVSFWQTYAPLLPSLAAVARFVIAAPATTARLEGFFSTTGYFDSPCRASASPMLMETCAIIKANSSFLKWQF